ISRQRGSHVVLRHPDRSGLVVVPVHRGQTLNRNLLDNILTQAGLSQADFRRLLWGGGPMRRYTVLLTPDDGQYAVRVPALPGCFSQGRTVAEALEHAREAIQLYLEDLAAHGEPIPNEGEAPQLAAVEVEAPPAGR